MQVLFYGQFIPLHGLDTIIAAARLLKDDAVEWTLVGRGQEACHIQRMLDEVPLPRMRWVDWVDYVDLNDWLARADVCLGVFGTSEKAASVIPNKVFQAIAAGRPIITRDSTAIRELLVPVPPCIYLVPAGDPQALADAIREHRDRLPRGWPVPRCHAALRDKIAAPAIGRRFAAGLVERLGRARCGLGESTLQET